MAAPTEELLIDHLEKALKDLARSVLDRKHPGWRDHPNEAGLPLSVKREMETLSPGFLVDPIFQNISCAVISLLLCEAGLEIQRIKLEAPKAP